MPFAGAQVTAPTGNFHPNIWALTLIGALGNLIGSVLAYWFGHAGGRPFLDKYGKFVLIRKRDLDHSDEFFKKHGEWAVFFGRWLPLVRAFISLPAGIARMNFPKFCAFTFVGALPVLLSADLGGNQAGSALAAGACLAAKGGCRRDCYSCCDVCPVALASPCAPIPTRTRLMRTETTPEQKKPPHRNLNIAANTWYNDLRPSSARNAGLGHRACAGHSERTMSVCHLFPHPPSHDGPALRGIAGD